MNFLIGMIARTSPETMIVTPIRRENFYNACNHKGLSYTVELEL
jgi:hypothetical protein